MENKQLKIFQQLVIVFLAAVLIPLCVTAFIVINVSQHAVRAELRYSAIITTDSIYQRLKKSIHEKKLSVLFVAKSFEYINSGNQIKDFLQEISGNPENKSSIKLIDGDENINKSNVSKYFKKTNIEIFPESNKNALLMYAKLDNGKYLRKQTDVKTIEEEVFKYLVDDKRQVYIIDSNNKIIMSHNGDENLFESLLPEFPHNYKLEEPIIFGKIKNLPYVFLKISEPDWAIVVITPKELIDYGIISARSKIITAIIVAALAIIVAGLLYSYYLNISLKQLFKAVSAVTSGNYRRKVRLIRNFFTPYEFVYLVDRFNQMAQKIDESYNDVQKANEELSKIDKLKSNLIDTVSHEFRTPLTSIKGYASRLLRSDITVDEETRIKSLKVIKQQSDRLSRLVDDLLVVPQIESELLRISPENINLRDILEDCIMFTQQKQTRQINLETDDNFPAVYADSDRLVQVITNLLENAVKYSPESSVIAISTHRKDNFGLIKIKNDCPPISKEKLATLFDKFTRIEDDLTRTTRGTGLGLFIVRGLIIAMGGEVFLSGENGFEISFTIPLAEDN